MYYPTEEIWLWKEIKYGNEEAFKKLYMDMYDHLFRYGMHISGDKELSLDCINEVFADIWKRRINLPEVDSVNGYLFIAFKRILFSKLKKNRKRQLYEKKSTAYANTHEYSYEYLLVVMQGKEERKTKMKRALGKLSDRQKELIEMRYFEDQSIEEIAENLEISLRTVYNTIYTAIKKLRKEMQNT